MPNFFYEIMFRVNGASYFVSKVVLRIVYIYFIRITATNVKVTFKKQFGFVFRPSDVI